MIRQAVSKDFEGLAPDTEAAARILGLVNAYGAGQPFLRLWCSADGQTDSVTGFASLLDGAAVLALRDDGGIAEEWMAFLSMQPEITSVRTSASAAHRMAERGGWTLKTGAVMTPGAAMPTAALHPENLSPRETYPLLAACFSEGLPSFSSWYVDVSHRLRHNCCRIVGVRDEEGKAVACAMTTAECRSAALIGAVATLPEGRGKGYASANVLALAHILTDEGRRVFLSPKNRQAQDLYARIGFTKCGQWGGLIRTRE